MQLDPECRDDAHAGPNVAAALGVPAWGGRDMRMLQERYAIVSYLDNGLPYGILRIVVLVVYPAVCVRNVGVLEYKQFAFWA